jgi:hypothetical protein
VREIVSPLAVRFSDQDRALDRVASRIDIIAQDVAHLKRELRYRRRNLRGATKRRHLIDIAAMGGRCPCCAAADVLDAAGQRSPFAESAHSNSIAPASRSPNCARWPKATM